MQRIIDWWNRINSGYEEINREIRRIANHCLGLLVFWALFSFGYLLFSSKSSADAFSVIFDVELLVYALLLLIMSSICVYFLRNSIFIWVAETCFDSFFTLVFIASVGVSIGALEIPFLDVASAPLFVTAFLFSFFGLLIKRIYISIGCEVQYRDKALQICTIVMVSMVPIFWILKLTN